MPDFPDGWDIVRPVYGNVTENYGSDFVAKNADTMLVTLTGKGRILGGCVFVNSTGTQANDLIIITLDGSNLTTLTFLELETYNIGQPYLLSVFIVRYNNSGYIYTVGFTPGINFEESFILTYRETHGRQTTVFYNVYYGLIE